MNLQYKMNQESISFLFDHSLLPKEKYTDFVELQYDLDELYSFIVVNTKEKEYHDYIEDEFVTVTKPIYDSMFFAVVEHHIFNCIKFK